MRFLKVIIVLVILFGIGIGIGVGYRSLQGTLFPAPFLASAGNPTPLANVQQSSNVAAVNEPAAPVSIPSPSALLSTVQKPAPPHPASPTPQNNNVVVLNQTKPESIPKPGGNELMLPQLQPKQATAGRVPAIGSQGETIWLPQAIEGCWQGKGGSQLQYLGGCPNGVSGASTPITLRWCFERIGNEPLKLKMAKGQYPGRVRQRWDVMSAAGQTIRLRETISYKTMMFLHVVDVGNWSCRITPNNQLECNENELARCGPTKWMQAPWFRGSGWVSARRVNGGNFGPRASSMR